MRVGDGRLRWIAGEVTWVVEMSDPGRFQADYVEAFVASWTARGFAESTIANDVGVLERMLAALGRPVWEVIAEDVDRVGEMASSGRAVSTRRNYLQVFRGFHRFLEVRKAAEIEVAFGVRLACPLDSFNTARHVSVGGLDLVLRWCLDDVRGRFPDSAVLLCDEPGSRMVAATIRNRLRHLMTVEGRPESDWFSPHGMRRACVTHNYERGRGSGCHPTTSRSLDSGLDHSLRASVGDLHRRRLPARGLGDAERPDRTGVSDADYVEAPDGRRPAGGMDRHPAGAEF